jgi:hypothetical protein
MPQVDYPKTLTQADWDKKKGLLARTKPTGIGKALSSLQRMHNAVNWGDLAPKWTTGVPTVLMLNKNYNTKKGVVESKVEPIEGHARSVATLALKWEKTFKADKLIPASAAKAAKAVADAATKYANDLAGVMAELTSERDNAKQTIVAAARFTLKPTLTKHLTKIDLFLKDINTFTSKANEANLQTLVSGDGGARGYCTACTFWDEVMVDYPDITTGVYTGKADVFLAPVNDYGAGKAWSWWESALDNLAIQKKVVLEDAYEIHADLLKKEVGNIKKFRGYVAKALGKL